MQWLYNYIHFPRLYDNDPTHGALILQLLDLSDFIAWISKMILKYFADITYSGYLWNTVNTIISEPISSTIGCGTILSFIYKKCTTYHTYPYMILRDISTFYSRGSRVTFQGLTSLACPIFVILHTDIPKHAHEMHAS